MIRRKLHKATLPAIIREVRIGSITYLSEEALWDLYDQVRRLERSGSPGVLIEAGCALGGSAIVIAAAKAKTRPLYVYDVFGMIPPPSMRDGEDVHARYEVIRSGQSGGISGETYYGYRSDLESSVADSFRRYGFPIEQNDVQLVKGVFEQTLDVDDDVALAHIDADWYESVRTCVERIAPRLVPGGVLVVDDYDSWSGCRTAIDEYFADRGTEYEFIRRSRLHIVRRYAS